MKNIALSTAIVSILNIFIGAKLVQSLDKPGGVAENCKQ